VECEEDIDIKMLSWKNSTSPIISFLKKVKV
jgi:hypothetical protein